MYRITFDPRTPPSLEKLIPKPPRYAQSGIIDAFGPNNAYRPKQRPERKEAILKKVVKKIPDT